ncbi:MAG: YHS domain-containing protein [Candidatus Omnitrophica bacterium]|nr:YHS domain-containing protein [Candidatus Omnitrophota bacterium]
MDPGHSKTQETKLVDVGNTICPVTGEKIDEKTKATYAYEGKIYNFCCPMCIDDFKKDPQKYIDIINKEKE